MEPTAELELHPLFTRAMKRWPWILSLSLLGALGGFLFSLLHPPRYQAEALLGVSIHYGVTQPLALVVEDRALSRMATLVMADTTLEQVLEQLSSEVRNARGWERPSDMRPMLRLEQRLSEWALIAFDEDPKIASSVAQTWAEVTLEVFDEANEHAWRASELLVGSFIVECQESMEQGKPMQVWECVSYPLGVEAQALQEELETEIELSRGMLPNISYELIRDAGVPTRPILWKRGWLVLAGTVMGFIVGCLLILVDYSPRRLRRNGSRSGDACGS